MSESKGTPIVPAKTSWGYGRPTAEIGEVLAFRVFPWRYVIGTGIAIPAYIVWFLFKLKFSFWSLLLFLIIGAALALPVFATFMVIHSRLVAAKTPLNQTGIVWKDAAFKAAWNGKKIPVETFYEAYMAEQIDIEGDLLDNFLYRRYDVLGTLTYMALNQTQIQV
jgi:hypothetical protein